VVGYQCFGQQCCIHLWGESSSLWKPQFLNLLTVKFYIEL